jgi:hypothetical protein
MVPDRWLVELAELQASDEPHLFWTVAFIVAPLVVQILEHVA